MSSMSQKLLRHANWFWFIGMVITTSPVFYRFEDWQYPRLILVSIAAFSGAILCRLEALAQYARVKEAGGEEGRSVSTDQDRHVGQGPRSPQSREAHADRAC
jgi:hypothetical protein